MMALPLRYIAYTLAIVTLGGHSAPAQETPSWTPQVLHLLATLPVQDEGRIKPLDTVAAFKLLRFNGKRSCRNLEGATIPPIAWLADCLFRPELARHYKVFRIDNSEVLEALGLPFSQKRDRYAYHDLEPALQKLYAFAQRYSMKEEQRRTPLENQLVYLAGNVHEFEALLAYTGFARDWFDIGDSPTLAALFPGQTHVPLSAALRKIPDIIQAYVWLKKDSGAPAASDSPELAALESFMDAVERAAVPARALALFPPSARREQTEWLAPSDMLECVMPGKHLDPSAIELLAAFETLVSLRDAPSEFEKQLAVFHDALVRQAKNRGEYGTIPLEVRFYRLKLFYYSLILYMASFLLIACSWLRPRGRLLARLGMPAVALPTALLAAGIVLRCIIRGRPPATTLYETILFTTAVAASASILVELLNRKRVALPLASIFGALGIFLAYKYELSEGSDTMPSMIAVLDTNFWLATHVTTITIGYGAGLLASAIGHVYVFGRLFGWRSQEPDFYSSVARMIYGVFCFGLLFAVLGTILGGIWAAESWGRFWGWDPKENGALMIVLWQLAVLHARADGIVRDLGVALGAVMGGAIITFSWFGVNLLGVGLHSYGFTSGTFHMLMAFYMMELLVMLLGAAVGLRGGRISKTSDGASSDQA